MKTRALVPLARMALVLALLAKVSVAGLAGRHSLGAALAALAGGMCSASVAAVHCGARLAACGRHGPIQKASHWPTEIDPGALAAAAFWSSCLWPLCYQAPAATFRSGSRGQHRRLAYAAPVCPPPGVARGLPGAAQQVGESPLFGRGPDLGGAVEPVVGTPRPPGSVAPGCCYGQWDVPADAADTARAAQTGPGSATRCARAGFAAEISSSLRSPCRAWPDLAYEPIRTCRN